MTYGYIRVSSDKQTVENQRFEINNFCKKQEIKIDGWIEETISGTKNYDKRKLGDLLNQVQKDDLIICAELSRLGRNLFMIMEILNICMTKECKVWTIKDNYRLGERYCQMLWIEVWIGKGLSDFLQHTIFKFYVLGHKIKLVKAFQSSPSFFCLLAEFKSHGFCGLCCSVTLC